MTLIYFLCVGFWPFWAQENKNEPYHPERKFSTQELKEDFKILRDALEEGHAGLYRYTSKERFDELFDSLASGLNRSLTEAEFLKMLLPLIANINDGHTGIIPSEAGYAYFENQPTLFPFNLRFVDKKAYLFRNYSEKRDVEMGSELVTINGNPISDVIKKILALLSSDAHIETSKFRQMESTAYFGRLYNLLYGTTPSYALEIKPPGDNRTKEIVVNGIKAKDTNSIFQKRYPEAAKDEPPIELEYRDEIAILTIRTFEAFAFGQAKIPYKDFMKETFEALQDKKIENLIIDLRNNGGGSDEYGKILFAYLTDKPFQYYAALETKKNEYDFFQYTNIPSKRRKLSERRFQKNERGWYDQLRHPNLATQKPLQPIYQGQTYILINGRSFSATGESTSVIHYHKKAIFVGEECGAGYYGNTSGIMPMVTLPHTKIRIRIPLVRYTMAVSGYPKDRGIVPEHQVSPTIEDLLQDRDSVMEFTVDLIKKKRQGS
jgi:C-terminal processing protease CtpA/Prc